MPYTLSVLAAIQNYLDINSSYTPQKNKKNDQPPPGPVVFLSSLSNY